jgi:rhamnosyltransferase
MSAWPKLANPSASSQPLAIGFVTYHPDAGFYARLAQLRELGVPVFLFDNAPSAADHARLNGFDREFLHYVTAGNNVGLGIGLSVICASAYARGHEYLLFFDQDTRFTAETLEYAKSLLRQQAEKITTSHVAVVLQAPRGDGTDHRLVDQLLAISSGMLFVLHNVARMGWHNPRYFVDGVDYEFCLRARARGYKIAVCSGAPGFDHVTDQADKDRVLFGRTLRLRKYPWRRVFDSIGAYARLSMTSLARGDLRGLWSVVRSMSIYILAQCLARFLLRESN